MYLKLSRELTCVISLSVGFMLLFAADLTMLNLQKTVVSSIADEKPGFTVEGYTVVGLLYTCFAITLWFGPYVAYALGAKLTLTISAFAYLCFVASYAVEDVWAIYAGAVIEGIAAGTLWPAQGQYLLENSTPKTTTRNVGIFFFIMNTASLLGNVFVYCTFYGKKYLNQHTRRTTIYILMAINVLAVVAFMFLPKPVYSNKKKDYGPIRTIKKSWAILTSAKMRWMVLVFCYAGLQQSFVQGIFSSSIGFTLALGNSAKELIALNGIVNGLGSYIGLGCPILLSKWIDGHHYSRRLIVLTGIAAEIVAFSIVYLNIPDNAVFGNTEEESWIHPRATLILLGSLLFGFGEISINTQIYSFIGDYFRENSAEVVALFKFIKGVFVAASFYYCSHVRLHTQLAVNAVVGVAGTIGFFMADRAAPQLKNKEEIVK